MCFALDEAAAQKTRELGVKCYFLDPSRYTKGGHANTFGDGNFTKTVIYKNAIIYDMLQLGVNVLFQGVDLVWFKDPLPYLLEHSNSFDILAMHDGINPLHRPYFANSGFMYIEGGEVGLAVFETALRNSSMIMGARSHQKPLNRIFQHFAVHNVLRLRILPEALFANGHLFNLVRGVRPAAGDWQNNAIVLHYSWTGTAAEKIMKLDKFGINYIGLKS